MTRTLGVLEAERERLPREIAALQLRLQKILNAIWAVGAYLQTDVAPLSDDERAALWGSTQRRRRRKFTPK